MKQGQQGWKEQESEIVRILERQNEILESVKNDLNRLIDIWQMKLEIAKDDNCQEEENFERDFDQELKDQKYE